MSATPPSSPNARSGRHDFDFLRGRWTVANRRLEHPLDPHSSRWQEFSTYVENQELLGGLGNVDKYRSDDFPGYADWEAIALRLFDPEQASWRIWWASTVSSGELDKPVVGAFYNGRGLFECDDVLGDIAVKVRYEWVTSDAQPVWRQAFSFDSGQSWRENWLMVWSRA